MPPPANPVVALLRAPGISPRTDLITTTDGRILRIVKEDETRPIEILEREANLYTTDLAAAKEMLKVHDYKYNVEYLNSCLEAYWVKNNSLFAQDGYRDLGAWIKASAAEIGISVGDFYRRMNVVK